jgi:hypothetical protein
MTPAETALTLWPILPIIAAACLVYIARRDGWPVKQWATDAALLPFAALGWLVGAVVYATELAYYAIMTGYENGRGGKD